jgi:hypothetical protein
VGARQVEQFRSPKNENNNERKNQMRNLKRRQRHDFVSEDGIRIPVFEIADAENGDYRCIVHNYHRQNGKANHVSGCAIGLSASDDICKMSNDKAARLGLRIYRYNAYLPMRDKTSPVGHVLLYGAWYSVNRSGRSVVENNDHQIDSDQDEMIKFVSLPPSSKRGYRKPKPIGDRETRRRVFREQRPRRGTEKVVAK